MPLMPLPDVDSSRSMISEKFCGTEAAAGTKEEDAAEVCCNSSMPLPLMSVTKSSGLSVLCAAAPLVAD